MADFRGSLEAICAALPGAVAASLMSADGLPVETHEASALSPGGEPVDLGSLMVEYSTVLGQVQRTGEVFAAGALEEISIRSQNLLTLMRPVNQEYFLALAMHPDANAGKGRYLLRIHAPRLIEDLT